VVAGDQDRHVLSRIGRGEALALRQVYEACAPRAKAVALRILRDRCDAEDVVQETFMELWRRAPQLDTLPGPVAAWVMTIARSRAIDRLRAESSARRAIEAAADHLVPPPQPTPDTLVGLRQDSERVRRALRTLPAKQRIAVKLAYFEGLSHREIAHETHQPLGTVKMRVRLAMDRLSTLLRT
jgi:RNA polymerase sigma-70 factor (ECF subfamily)